MDIGEALSAGPPASILLGPNLEPDFEPAVADPRLQAMIQAGR
jgi:hypothetical protein